MSYRPGARILISAEVTEIRQSGRGKEVGNFSGLSFHSFGKHLYWAHVLGIVPTIDVAKTLKGFRGASRIVVVKMCLMEPQGSFEGRNEVMLWTSPAILRPGCPDFILLLLWVSL